jgi:di/tricarboxylate transporter
MVTTGILSEQEARDSIKWDIFLTIGAAFAITKAMVNSGVAGKIAGFLVKIGTGVGLGDAGLVGAVFFATTMVSAVVTNNAAAALLFPVALDAADRTGVSIRLISYALMLGASDYMTPFGYATNLLVYGPGNYKSMDYFYFGAPLQVLLWLTTTAFLVIEPIYISWIVMFIVFGVVVVLRVGVDSLFSKSPKDKADTDIKGGQYSPNKGNTEC